MTVVPIFARAIGPLLLGVLLAVSCSPGPSRHGAAEPGSSTTRAHPANAGGRPGQRAQVLRCGDFIATADGPSPGHSIVLDQVALPTDVALQANDSGEADPAARLFAKDGLLIRPGASFELVIPEDARGHASIGWGSPSIRTSRVVIAGCGTNNGDRTWLVYPGGYWVAEPMCLSLVVKAAQATEQVSVGVGASCPGHASPLPAAGS